MKKSWEIIVAGILLLFVAIFITSKDDNGEQEAHQRENNLRTAIVQSEQNQQQNSQSLSVRVIQLEELAELEELKALEMKSLEGLEKLKELSKLIPKETKQEIVAEINAAIAELENDSISIDFNLDDKVVLVQKEYPKTEGSWERVSVGVYAYTKKFDASSFKDVSVQLSGGSIILVGTDEKSGSVTVKASGDVSSGSSLEENVAVDFLNKNSKAEFRVSQKGTKNSNVQLQTIVTIPSSMNIISYTSGGHIEATNFAGDCEVKTAGGHIKLDRIQGDVTAFTEGGHVTLTGGKGDVSLKSLGGHLQAIDTEGTLEMRTSGGNVAATNFSGSVNAFTSGGNIKLDIKSLGGEVQARNGAGQIELFLPSSPGFNLSSSGTKIDFDSGFNFSVREKKKGQLNGTVGDGQINVIAKTGYGTVTITKND